MYLPISLIGGYVGFSLVGLYALLVGFFVLGLLRRPRSVAMAPSQWPQVSVLVAARNEAHNLGALLHALAQQHYPVGRWELVLIDDHSSDHTHRWIETQSYPWLRYHPLPQGQQGKKAALAYAAGMARGQVFLFTDADCVPGPFWLQSLAGPMANGRYALLAGPVSIAGLGWWAAWQQLELSALMQSAAGSMAWNRPLMCSGANLAVQAQVYRAHLQSLRPQLASGDDMFLMLALHRARQPMAFVQAKRAVVYTQAQAQLGAFVQQRRRWATKTPHLRSVWIWLVGLLVLVANLAWPIALVFDPRLGACLWLVKSLPDFVLLTFGPSLVWRNLLRWFIPLQVLYPVYLLLSVWPTKLYWKGRAL